jgi:hypothetical protein
MSNFLSTSDLAHDDLKSSFKTYLKSQERFKDYNFEGSNFAVLIDILMQNTMYNNHYLNMMGAESYLDSAELRESIVSRAKELNYTPRSRTSSRASLDVTITPEDNPNSILIPKGYRFKSRVNNVNYYFSTRQNYKLTKSDNVYTLAGIEVFEGESITEYFTLNSVTENGVTTYSNEIIINSENVDTSSLEVYVTINNEKIEFTKAASLIGLSSTSRVYFVEGYRANQYKIVFGDGVLGEAIQSGSTVEISYLDTVGEDANGINTFTFTESIQGYSSISVVTNLSSYGGSERESNANVKYSAPRHYQTQETAVTEYNYKDMVVTNFPEIQAVSAYGGEEELLYSKVLVALKPYNSTNASDILKARISSFLNSKNLTTEVIIRDLEYFYIKVASNIKYNPNDTTDTASNIKSAIITKLLTLNDSQFNKFIQGAYSSNISNMIDESNDAITSNSLFLKIGKRITPTNEVETAYNIKFANEIQAIAGSVKSSTFTYQTYEAWIEDDGDGNLGLYTLNTTGNNTLIENIGSVNYTTGELTFDLTVTEYTDYISIFAETKSRDIEVTNNNYIIFDSADFELEMVANA